MKHYMFLLVINLIFCVGILVAVQIGAGWFLLVRYAIAILSAVSGYTLWLDSNLLVVPLSFLTVAVVQFVSLPVFWSLLSYDQRWVLYGDTILIMLLFAVTLVVSIILKIISLGKG